MRRRLAALAAIGALALTGACSNGPEVDVSAADGESSGSSEQPSSAGEETPEPDSDGGDEDAQATAAELGDPVATRKAGVHGYQLRVDVFAVERRGTLADLNFAVSLLEAEDADDDFQVAQTFSDGNYDSADASGFAVDGVRLLDGTNGKVHLAASDGQGSCLCTRDLSGTFIDPGDTIVMSATYAAPPEDVDTVSVQIPKFGTFTDVPVQ
jgi:hypothetical protein